MAATVPTTGGRAATPGGGARHAATRRLRSKMATRKSGKAGNKKSMQHHREIGNAQRFYSLHGGELGEVRDAQGVIVASVIQALVASEGVRHRHRSPGDAKIVVQHLEQRRHAHGRARGVRHEVVGRGGVRAIVDTHDVRLDAVAFAARGDQPTRSAAAARASDAATPAAAATTASAGSSPLSVPTELPLGTPEHDRSVSTPMACAAESTSNSP